MRSSLSSNFFATAMRMQLHVWPLLLGLLFDAAQRASSAFASNRSSSRSESLLAEAIIGIGLQIFACASHSFSPATLESAGEANGGGGGGDAVLGRQRAFLASTLPVYVTVLSLASPAPPSSGAPSLSLDSPLCRSLVVFAKGAAAAFKEQVPTLTPAQQAKLREGVVRGTQAAPL